MAKPDQSRLDQSKPDEKPTKEAVFHPQSSESPVRQRPDAKRNMQTIEHRASDSESIASHKESARVPGLNLQLEQTEQEKRNARMNPFFIEPKEQTPV